MKVGRENSRSREQALVLLALALAVKLLEPFIHHRVCRLIADHHFNLFAASVKEISRCCVLVAVILFNILVAKLIHCSSSALHDSVNVDSRNGNGKKSDSRKNGITSSDIVGNNESLIALCIRKSLERSSRLVRSSIDTLCRFLCAVLALKHLSENPESNRRLRGCARF